MTGVTVGDAIQMAATIIAANKQSGRNLSLVAILNHERGGIHDLALLAGCPSWR